MAFSLIKKALLSNEDLPSSFLLLFSPLGLSPHPNPLSFLGADGCISFLEVLKSPLQLHRVRFSILPSTGSVSGLAPAETFPGLSLVSKEPARNAA